MTSLYFTTKIEKQESVLYWNYHIPVPDDITKQLRDNNAKRIVCKINDNISFQCALMPLGDGSYFINVNKELRTKIERLSTKELNIELTLDTSKYGLPMPEELQELLSQDIEGDKVFHSLTAGKQRNLLHIIGKFKSTEKRLEKSLITINYLKQVKGKLDFKELNIAYKAGL